MMPTRFLAFGLGILLLSSCRSSTSAGSGSGPKELQPAVNEVSISDSLAQLFLRFHSSGSITVRGRCTDASFIVDEIPKGATGAFSNLEDALAAWSRLLPRLTMRHDTDGMWRVSDSTASAELLRLRIKDLRVEGFDGGSAIDAVLDTNDVKQFLRDHGISQASTLGGIGPYDASKLPHSSWHLRDITVGEAFDAAITKYPGVWVYTECASDEHNKLINVRALGF